MALVGLDAGCARPLSAPVLRRPAPAHLPSPARSPWSPELLIADEPVSALDVSVQAQVLELLDDVRQRFDLAVLFITHDLRVAAQVCDRIAVMQRGVVVEQGPTAEVFAAPKHEYTRALFDSAPRGRISSSGSSRIDDGCSHSVIPAKRPASAGRASRDPNSPIVTVSR